MQAKTINKPRLAASARQSSTPEKANYAPTQAEIAKRAYEIYLSRGKTPGREQDDWFQAERELSAKANRNN